MRLKYRHLEKRKSHSKMTNSSWLSYQARLRMTSLNKSKENKLWWRSSKWSAKFLFNSIQLDLEQSALRESFEMWQIRTLLGKANLTRALTPPSVKQPQCSLQLLATTIQVRLPCEVHKFSKHTSSTWVSRRSRPANKLIKVPKMINREANPQWTSLLLIPILLRSFNKSISTSTRRKTRELIARCAK